MSTLQLNEPDTPLEATPGSGPVYFPVSALKMTVMSLGTLGLYEIYWFYKQWDCERDRTHESLSPFWRTFFAHLFAYSLFDRIKGTGHRLSVPVGYSPAGLWAAFFVLTIASLHDALGFLPIVSFLPLLPVRAAIERINAARDPQADTNWRFSALNVVGVVVGFVALALALFRMFGSGPGAIPTSP